MIALGSFSLSLVCLAEKEKKNMSQQVEIANAIKELAASNRRAAELQFITDAAQQWINHEIGDVNIGYLAGVRLLKKTEEKL